MQTRNRVASAGPAHQNAADETYRWQKGRAKLFGALSRRSSILPHVVVQEFLYGLLIIINIEEKREESQDQLLVLEPLTVASEYPPPSWLIVQLIQQIVERPMENAGSYLLRLQLRAASIQPLEDMINAALIIRRLILLHNRRMDD